MWSFLRHPNCCKKNFIFFLSSIRMTGKNINFGDKKIKKRDFCKNKKTFNMDDTDVNKISVSKEEPYGINKSAKYFIGYSDNGAISPWFIMFPQMTGFAKNFESNKTMSFKVNDNKLLKMYTQIWGKVRNLLNVKFDSEPVYGDTDK